MKHHIPVAAAAPAQNPSGVIFFDGNIVFGCGPILPINNLPSGVLKIRIRQRETKQTIVYLKFWDHTEAWEIETSPCKCFWQLSVCLQRNAIRR